MISVKAHSLCSYWLLVLVSLMIITTNCDLDHQKRQAGKQYSGFINVNLQQDANLFYWVIESQGDPSTDPIVLWVSGGPGCSGGLALLYENGPLMIPDNQHTYPIPNPYSWNKYATVIWIDQPSYTGYSYSRSPYVHDEDGVVLEMKVFFYKFFSRFPQYQHLPLYISGESYGGHYVPSMAYMILNENTNPSTPLWINLNLKGISIGNGVVDPLFQYPNQGLYAYQQSVINSTAYATIAPIEKACYQAIKNSDWNTADDACNNIIIQVLKYAPNTNPMNFKLHCAIADCFLYTSITNYLNDPQTKLNLNVPQSVVWQACNFDVVFTSADTWSSFSWKISQLLAHNISTLVYYGDLDLVAPVNGGLLWASNMDWSGREGFTKAKFNDWKVNGNAAGQYKTYANFTFLQVYNGGHMTPHDQPQNSLELFRKFVQNLW